ncbi:MAG: YidC/Oxa1 family membrane protein insertase [Bacilli bacterium]
MKKNKNAKRIVLVLISLVMLTGCTKNLTNEEKKVVKLDTGKTLTENILCRPTDEKSIELYKENGVDINELPTCENFKPFDEYEGLWTTIFVKPLAWIIIKIGVLLEKIGLGSGFANGLAIILSCLAIRLILYPLTRKTAMQSEKMKEVQPALEKLEKKYKNKTSEEDQKRKAEEMMLIYQKNKINPVSSCLLSFIQIPLLFAYLEAINRTPVIFENKFLKLDMGMTISRGIMSNLWYVYLLLLLLILATSYLSFRKTLKDQATMQSGMKGMIYFMLAMVVIASFSLPVALGLYWITSSIFTVIQNLIVERKKVVK